MAILSTHSRRRILSLGAAATAFAPSLARAADTLPQPIGDDADGVFVQGATDIHKHLTLSVTIDGQGPFRFVVDTGADRSVVSDEVAAKLGLIRKEDVIVQGIARSVGTQTVFLKELKFGAFSSKDLMAPVLPRAWLGADGYLGLDVIDNRRVIFDFQKHRLAVVNSSEVGGWLHASEVVVRVSGSNGRLRAVDCFVEGVPAYAFIDSGAQISIGNSRLFQDLAKVGTTYIKDTEIPLIGVTGGSTPGKLTSISNIRVGGLTFANSILAISDLEVFDLWGLANKPALFIGMNFLRQMSQFSIDYRRKELRFKLASLMLARA